MWGLLLKSVEKIPFWLKYDENRFAVLHAFEVWHISEEFIRHLHLTACFFLLVINTEVIFGCASKNKKHISALQDFCVLFHVFMSHSQLIYITYTQRMWTNIFLYYQELSAKYNSTDTGTKCILSLIYNSRDTRTKCTISLTYNSTDTRTNYTISLTYNSTDTRTNCTISLT
jgi:hypothetical protein